ncbi:hypothetical protein CAE01nite_04110 [Cellulomonas aerilata]|uniref:Uncharacterized protein n=1 Tax=Cellulomonas aerilata TaxID=515326 RepID=A0A512D885_9CELL|nr:hypothetical protein CAE01nite_04110 [Cellulomonas aerilata]
MLTDDDDGGAGAAADTGPVVASTIDTATSRTDANLFMRTPSSAQVWTTGASLRRRQFRLLDELTACGH